MYRIYRIFLLISWGGGGGDFSFKGGTSLKTTVMAHFLVPP